MKVGRCVAAIVVLAFAVSSIQTAQAARRGMLRSTLVSDHRRDPTAQSMPPPHVLHHPRAAASYVPLTYGYGYYGYGSYGYHGSYGQGSAAPRRGVLQPTRGLLHSTRGLLQSTHGHAPRHHPARYGYGYGTYGYYGYGAYGGYGYH